MSRWAKAGIRDRVFDEIRVWSVLHVEIEVVRIVRTSVKVRTHGTGALNEAALKPLTEAGAVATPRCIRRP